MLYFVFREHETGQGHIIYGAMLLCVSKMDHYVKIIIYLCYIFACKGNINRIKYCPLSVSCPDLSAAHSPTGTRLRLQTVVQLNCVPEASACVNLQRKNTMQIPKNMFMIIDSLEINPNNCTPTALERHCMKKDMQDWILLQQRVSVCECRSRIYKT